MSGDQDLDREHEIEAAADQAREQGLEPMVDPAPPARRERCSAEHRRDRMVCDRCGQSWLAIVDGPACRPLAWPEMAERLVDEVIAAETSLTIVRGMAARGIPTDGGAAAERRLAILKKISRLVDRIAADPELRAYVTAAVRR